VGCCGLGEIICRSFLRQVWYKESRGQRKFSAKNGELHSSGVEGVRLKVGGGHTKAISVNGDTVFFVRQRVRMVRMRQWWGN